MVLVEERSRISEGIIMMVAPCPGCDRPVLGGVRVARPDVSHHWWHEACYDLRPTT